MWGGGMMFSLAALGPIYSIVYTNAAIHPNGKLAKVTASDPDIPKGVANAKWSEVPGIWWGVVEHLSWTMLGKQTQLDASSELWNYQSPPTCPQDNLSSKFSHFLTLH